MYTMLVHAALSVSQGRLVNSYSYFQKLKGYQMSNKLNGSYMTRQELEELFKASRATIYRWVKNGHLPKPIQLGANMVRWKVSDIEEWMIEREAT
jgi:prophage regulatory protein